MRTETTPRLTVASVAPMIDGRRRPAPQPLGTWMTRWYAIYQQTPTVTSTPELQLVPQLTRSAA